MKRVLLTASLLFCLFSVHSQSNFEGIITYNYGVKELNNATLSASRVYFKGHKILIKVSNGETGSNDSTETLLDFDSGFIYHIDHDQKEITIDSLKKTSTENPIFKTNNGNTDFLLGYSCYKYSCEKIMFDNDSISAVHLWFADSLYFELPKKYEPFLNTMYYTNGKNICLSGEFTTVIYRFAETVVNIKAVMVSQYSLPDSIFFLPKSYKIIPREIPFLQKNARIELLRVENNDPPPPPPPPLLQTAKKKTVKTTPAKRKQ
ncbi:MAG: hypothetical protein JST86_13295 [Bacteroidetes bacterium]|nr:hypothetical protein [Bacteroidota bacterium]